MAVSHIKVCCYRGCCDSGRFIGNPPFTGSNSSTLVTVVCTALAHPTLVGCSMAASAASEALQEFHQALLTSDAAMLKLSNVVVLLRASRLGLHAHTPFPHLLTMKHMQPCQQTLFNCIHVCVQTLTAAFLGARHNLGCNTAVRFCTSSLTCDAACWSPAKLLCYRVRQGWASLHTPVLPVCSPHNTCNHVNVCNNVKLQSCAPTNPPPFASLRARQGLGCKTAPGVASRASCASVVSLVTHH